MAAARRLDFDDDALRDARDRLVSEHLIDVSATTEALILTLQGIDEAERVITGKQLRQLDDPFPTTRAGIRDEMNYWAQHQHDGQVGSDHWIAVESRLTQLRHLDQTTPQDEEIRGKSHQRLLVFISHSSQDETLAKALIDLLKAAIGLVANQIRCSSVDGYRLPVGVNTEDQLRAEVNATKVVIGLITPSSLASHFVMFELGARWGGKLFLAPLLAGVEPRELKAPLGLLNALSAHKTSQLHQLVENIAQVLGMQMQSAASYSDEINAVKRLAEATPKAATLGAPNVNEISALQQQNSSLSADIARLREELTFKGKIHRINGHTYVDGDDAEMCSRCAAVEFLAVPLQDMNLDGRGRRATCPQCKMPRGNGPPIPRKRSEEIARRIADEAQ